MFHSNLREARELSGYSQKDFAQKLGIPVTTYRNYENTMREPSYDILIKIAEMLNMSVDQLLGTNTNNDKYLPLFAKIKQLSESKFQTICAFVDFLVSRK